jgi:hypothetical protein
MRRGLRRIVIPCSVKFLDVREQQQGGKTMILVRAGVGQMRSIMVAKPIRTKPGRCFSHRSGKPA